MFQTFEEFIATSSTQIPLVVFIINILLTAVLSLLLGKIYEIYGSSLSNRKLFSRNFLLIAMTTMLIITVVKSSLALSLGLVGALSIIRFRAAIKEPEELGYIFLVIAVGLGFGANQGTITVIAFSIISAIIVIVKKLSQEVYENQNLHLTISSSKPANIGVDKIVEVLREDCSVVNLRRLDETNEIIEVSFLVEFRDFNQLNKTKIRLQHLDEKLSFSFLDNKGVY